MDDAKPSKRKKTSSNDQSAPKEKKKKKEKESHLSKETEITDNPPLKPEKPKKRKRDTTTDEPEKKKKKSKKDKTSKSEPKELEIDITAPTPPSKKALRLQKKGKPIPPVPSTSQPPPSTATAEDTTHPDRKTLVKEIPRAEFSVWIGNLSYKSEVKGLRGWLVRGDNRVRDKDITRVNLPLNADGQSKGFAYVDFGTEEAMEKVISRSEESLDGRNLLIKNAKSFAGRPAEKKQRYQVKQTPSSAPTVTKGGSGGNANTSAEKSETVPKKDTKVKPGKAAKVRGE